MGVPDFEVGFRVGGSCEGVGADSALGHFVSGCAGFEIDLVAFSGVGLGSGIEDGGGLEKDIHCLPIAGTEG